jgi:hypothetical protein
MRKGLAAAVALLCLLAGRRADAPPSPFAALVAQLSEPPGSFDTDNLISNERSYLQVMPALESPGLRGGVYLGVGPDQNFSYIARIRPALAIIVDIRRDNLLLHLLFKALFERAPTRAEYLCRLFGRAPPTSGRGWRTAPIDRLVAYVDRAGRLPAAESARQREMLDEVMARFGVPLSDEDRDTIHRFHQAFIDGGLDMRFESLGRRPRSYYPTYRDLLLETDPAGRHANFLAAEDDYQFVRTLEAEDLVVPVVGNLGGETALAAIGRLVARRHQVVSAFYTSNVEFYLFGAGRFQQFVRNLQQLPHGPHSLIIRSVFGGYAYRLAPAGSYSASLTQPIDKVVGGFADGTIRSYGDLVGIR